MIGSFMLGPNGSASRSRNSIGPGECVPFVGHMDDPQGESIPLHEKAVHSEPPSPSKHRSDYSFLSRRIELELFEWNNQKYTWRRFSKFALLGIPLGLVHGTIPFLLRSGHDNSLTFTDLGLFSLVSYPYSLKLLWSPIVDSYYWKSFGRRKSWIVPSQFIAGFILIWISFRIEHWILHADTFIGPLTVAFAFLILSCATQDISVDGWALTLLDPDQVHFSSTCQSIGINTGYFVSFTLFLAFNSVEFCNNYIRWTASPTPIWEISSFLFFWGVAYIIGTLAVAYLKKEDDSVIQETKDGGIMSVYKNIYRIIKLPYIRKLAIVLLLARVGFVALDAVLPLKLIERGFPKEDLALTVLVDYPCQIAIGVFAAGWTKGSRPLFAWQKALVAKLLIALFGMIVLASFPTNGAITTFYFILVTTQTVLGSFTSTILFISMSSFFSRISDASIGGTYMTLLNTINNLGGLWPKLIVFAAVDWLTWRRCTNADCVVVFDGYYFVNVVCVLMGGSLAFYLLIPAIRKLESLPLRAWHITTSSPIPAHLANLV